MTFQEAGGLSLAIFSVFAVVMAGICYKAVRLTSSWKLWLGVLVALVAVFSAMALSGVVASRFVPFGPVLFALLFACALWFSFSKSGGELASVLSLTTLIGFQGFRFPLELILHQWVNEGTIPGTMTWTGQNWDIVTGVGALLAAPFVRKNRALAIGVNLVGFLLLMNVVRVVVLSSPLPFGWRLERPLLLVAHFPYALIGPLFVMPALVGHLIAFRALLGPKRVTELNAP